MNETTYNKIIELPDGSIFTLEYNDKFIEKVRAHFKLESNEFVDDDLLKEFFALSLASV
jgi:hypothetical protein